MSRKHSHSSNRSRPPVRGQSRHNYNYAGSAGYIFPLLMLACVLAALAGLIAVLDWKDQKSDSQWTLLAADSVSSIQIVAKPDKPKTGDAHPMPAVELHRSASGWQLKRPVVNNAGEVEIIETAANSDRVTPLLALLQLPRRTSYALDEISLDELGLEPPQAQVTIDGLEFHFGDITANGTTRYVKVNERVHLYQEFVFPMLMAGAKVFAATAE